MTEIIEQGKKYINVEASFSVYKQFGCYMSRGHPLMGFGCRLHMKGTNVLKMKLYIFR
jgi:hypothetical protein